MTPTINRTPIPAEQPPLSDKGYLQPRYDIEADDRSVEIAVVLPEIADEGLEILLHQDQLIVTARRNRVVRPNWGALRLECAQQDYRLNIQLGFAALPESIRTVLTCGILSIRVDRTPERVAC